MSVSDILVGFTRTTFLSLLLYLVIGQNMDFTDL